MIGKLIAHSWKMFRRSDLFEKSLFVMIILSILALFALAQLSILGRALPVILNEHFPERTPGAWVYGFLIPVMLMDLFTRLVFQSLPARHVTPYLHLPISRSEIATYWIVRSWLQPFNFYLLFFFYSFIRITINPETSSQGLGLLGIFSLSAINQSIVIWFKTTPGNKLKAIIPIGIVSAFILVTYTWHLDVMINFSLSMFLRFVNGDVMVFSIIFGLVLLLHLLSFRQIQGSFRNIYDQEKGRNLFARNTRWENFLAGVPIFGPYWLIEWRLVSRSKRSRINFFVMIPMAIVVSVFILQTSGDSPEAYAIVLFMIAGSYGNFHLQHAFSWESHFFDFLATRDFKMGDFIQAKFNFYFAYSTLQFAILFPIMLWFNQSLAILFAGMYLYACGFGFYFYLRTAIGNSTRFDANGKSSFNLEGVTGLKFLQVFILFLSIVPFFILGTFLPFENGTAIALGFTGLIFIATQKWWSLGLAKKLERRKYINLNLYRQK